MSIHVFTKYTRSGASSRYRSFQYLPALEAVGFQFSVLSLFDDAYLAYKYTHGRAHVGHVLCAFVRRLWAVLSVPRGAVVMIEYELLPWFPALLERWLVWRGCRLIVDYDDALFHQYDEHANPWVRCLLGTKIATVMRIAHTVVAGNAYLADYARRAGALRMVIIPTVIDLASYPLKPKVDLGDIFTIGWIGSPSTAHYLQALAPALAAVCQGGRARVCLVGSGPIYLPGVPTEVIAWSEHAEVDEIRRFDVGIMPLPDEPWARGKCGFKLIQYMACGLPVVASPVGVNQTIVQHGVNGYLASTTAEWVEALQMLMQQFELRQAMGHAGRLRVEQEFCLQVTASKLIKILRMMEQAV